MTSSGTNIYGYYTQNTFWSSIKILKYLKEGIIAKSSSATYHGNVSLLQQQLSSQTLPWDVVDGSSKERCSLRYFKILIQYQKVLQADYFSDTYLECTLCAPCSQQLERLTWNNVAFHLRIIFRANQGHFSFQVGYYTVPVKSFAHLLLWVLCDPPEWGG